MSLLTVGVLRMRVIALAAASLTILCSLTVTGCAGDLNGSREGEWKTFEDGYASISLPPSFRGGNPREQGAVQELRELASSNPDPEMRVALEEYVDGLEADFERDEYLHELVMWEPPRQDGSFASVEVTCPTPQDGQSLEGYIDLLVGGWWEDRRVTLESLTDDRAFVVLQGSPYEGEPESLTYYLFRLREPVLYESGATLYMVTYRFGELSDEALADIYRQSAMTFILMGFDEPLESL